MDVFFGDSMEGEIGADLFLGDHAADFFDQGRVFENEEVGIEDICVLGTEAAGDLALDFLNLAACIQEGLLETFELIGDRLG